MDIFSIFFNMKVYCVFSLESPHRGNSNEHIQCTTVLSMKKKICSYGIFSEGPKNEFERVVVNKPKPSVFKLLKFYCILYYKVYNSRWDTI